MSRSDLRRLYDEDDEPKSYPTEVGDKDKVLVLVLEAGDDIQGCPFRDDMALPAARFVFFKVSVTLAESLFGC